MVNICEYKLIVEFIFFVFYDEICCFLLNFDVIIQVIIRIEIKIGGFYGCILDVSVIDCYVWCFDFGDYRVLIELVQLVVEVVFSNWEMDYFDKLDEY